MKRNTDYKNDALAALKGNWGKAVLATVIYMAIVYIAMGPYLYQNFKFQAAMTASGGAMDAEALVSQMSTVTGYAGLYGLLTIFLIAPLMVGFINAFRVLLLQGDREIPTNMYKIATKGYWHKVWGMFLMSVFIFLWSMLFVIPGIIKAFSYAMTPYILEEHPELTANEAIVGWGILCIPTLGIGTFWLIPYMQTAQASFYEDVKADYEVNGGLV